MRQCCLFLIFDMVMGDKGAQYLSMEIMEISTSQFFFEIVYRRRSTRDVGVWNAHSVVHMFYEQSHI